MFDIAFYIYLADIVDHILIINGGVLGLSILLFVWVCCSFLESNNYAKIVLKRRLYLILSIICVTSVIAIFTPSKSTVLIYAGLLARETATQASTDAPVAEKLLTIIEKKLGFKLSVSKE